MKKLWLNRNQLKYLVIVAMLIDHIAWGFVPLESVAGQVMHFIGRLTGPTMGYFLAEGYIHTRNKGILFAIQLCGCGISLSIQFLIRHIIVGNCR